MARQAAIRQYIYVDAFAGAGVHLSKATGQMVPGSPLNALDVTPPFTALHLIDLDGARVAELKRLASVDPRVTIHEVPLEGHT
jgi:three-Cys-motif partner protein